MVEQLNQIARLWWDWSAAMLWQVGLLIILIGCIDLLIRRWAWPQLRYALWSLILIKLLLPPTLSLPSGIVPELQPAVSRAIRLMNVDRSAAGEMADFGLVRQVGLRIADLNPAMRVQCEPINLPSAGPDSSDVEFEISDLTPDVNPQSAIYNPQLAWQVYAMLVWLAGTLILGIWLFLRLHSFCSRHASSAAAASLPQSLYNQIADCANRLRLRHIPRVVVTKRLATPAVFGAVRPVLLMPKGYLSKLSRRDTEHMLLHELAHVKRGDLVMHSLYMLLQIAYWYNPLLWLVRRQMHHLRELSCDATVANLLRERTLAYRQTLLETARRLLAASVEPGLGLLGLFEDSNRLLVRLNWLTKPTWRYRTMKRAIVIAIAALMIACVLPMAQARQRPSDEVKDVTQNESISVSTEERSQQSQGLKALQQRLDQMMAEQRQLEYQVQALAGRRRAASAEQEPGDQLSQELNSLQKHLDEMTIQQQQLQEQLRALAAERQPLAEGRRERQRDVVDGRRGGTRRERAEEDIDVTVPSRNAPADVESRRGGGRPGGRETPELRDETGRQRSLDRTGTALDEAKRAFGRARETQVRVQRQYADRMKALGAELEQWQQSEQMQQWRRQIENWQKQVQEWAQSLVHRQRDAEGGPYSEAAKPAPMPPMPPMPELPKMPPVPSPAPFEGGIDVQVPEIEPPVPPAPPIPPEVPEDAENQGEIVSRSSFGSIPGDRILEVENHVGSITVRSADQSGYEVHAVTRVKADTKERIREIAEQLSIIDSGPLASGVGSITASKPGGVECITVSKPKDLRDRESVTVAIEVTAPRNARLKLRQDVGDIRLIGLRGSVDAFDRVGSIRGTDVAGQLTLNVEVGGIDLIVPPDLSARVKAQAEMGGVKSDFPLEVTKADALAMGHSASGTIGRGDDVMSLTTKMGSIHIRSQPSEPRRAGGGRPGLRSESRSEPRPEPRPEAEF